MRIPVWLAIAVAAFVTLFGAYRIKLGLTQTAEQEAEAKQRGGLYGMGKRFHLFVGVIYLVMGAALTAMAFGWHPFGGGATEAPSKAGDIKYVPIDQMPSKK